MGNLTVWRVRTLMIGALGQVSRFRGTETITIILQSSFRRTASQVADAWNLEEFVVLLHGTGEAMGYCDRVVVAEVFGDRLIRRRGGRPGGRVLA